MDPTLAARLCASLAAACFVLVACLAARRRGLDLCPYWLRASWLVVAAWFGAGLVHRALQGSPLWSWSLLAGPGRASLGVMLGLALAGLALAALLGARGALRVLDPTLLGCMAALVLVRLNCGMAHSHPGALLPALWTEAAWAPAGMLFDAGRFRPSLYEAFGAGLLAIFGWRASLAPGAATLRLVASYSALRLGLEELRLEGSASGLTPVQWGSAAALVISAVTYLALRIAARAEAVGDLEGGAAAGAADASHRSTTVASGNGLKT